MADKNNELEALRAENEALKAAVAKAGKGKVSAPVAGKFTASWTSPTDEKVTKTVKFKDGRVNVSLANGELAKTESFLKLANGKKLTTQEIADSPALKGMTTAAAAEYMTSLVQRGAGMLEEAK